ncbi:hypothetical protein K402DRAFT_390059 [Aulographum hederae CBS 113979]|uniref:Autophagy-related protein 28 n=1 Tax=Aulographum hederae CBS 113979 TaxID=1176131 RepID=A0A6G1HBN6_9PEZI|nr:hypothetical protein K402DRAFT_390059 [Aulographum hederae CBS 113979]
MSLFASWLQEKSPKSGKFSRAYEQGLPFHTRHAESSTSTTAFPPPPIASSMHASTIRLRENIAAGDEMLSLQRRDRQLQEELQMLVDAQGEALMLELGGSLPDDHTSDGSSTPTIQSLQLGARSPNRTPIRRKLGLKGARRGIWRTIHELAAVKAQQNDVLENHIEEDQEILDRIEGWENKQHGLQKEVLKIEESQDGDKTRELHEEADRLQIEINEMESRLAALKMQHRNLVSEISTVDNTVQAQLSSYKVSLSMLDKDIRNFLERPPKKDSRTNSIASNFFSLPPKRRTLSMAKEYWQDEQAEFIKKGAALDTEREALEEGAVVWKEVVTVISDFERYLREEMQSLSGSILNSNSNSGSNSRGKRRASSSSSTASSAPLDRMDQVLGYLKEQRDLADAKDWKLLVVVIGSELAAFTEGREILQATLAPKEQKKTSESLIDEQDGLDGHGAEHEDSESDKIHLEGLKSGKSYSSEDDEPDPELLISHQETDEEL